MLELMNEKALELGTERRREVALETMRASRASENRDGKAVGGLMLTNAGLRVADEELAPRPRMQPVSDRL
jgi:hypothetical protein